MRAKQISIAVAAVVLGGWLTAAAAQDAGAGNMAQPSVDSMPAWQVQSYSDLPQGIVGQPTVWNPGLVYGVSLGELYTDNLALNYSGQSKQTDWITVVQPFVRAARNGPRFFGVVNYMLTGYGYADHSSDNRVGQDLDARGRFTLLPQHLFLDGFAKYEHENVDNNIGQGYGSFYLNTNSTNVGMLQLGPYWQQDLGKAGMMTLRYSVARVVYDRSGDDDTNTGYVFPDVTSNGIQFKLEQPRDAKLGWSLNYAWQRLNPSFGDDIRYQSATGEVWYRVNQTLRVLGDLGRENNYRADGTSRPLGATRWDVGLQWTTPTNDATLKLGHRFFGPSAEFSWTHTAARLTTVLRYENRPTDINAELLSQNLGSATVWPINVSQPGSVTQPYPGLTARGPGVYVMRRGSFGVNYEMANSKLSASVYNELRHYFVPDGGPQRIGDARIAWMFELGPRMSLTPSIDWQRLEYAGGLQTNPRTVQLQLMREISPHDFATLRYRHGGWDYEQMMAPTRDYDVNVLYAQWIHVF